MAWISWFFNTAGRAHTREDVLVLLAMAALGLLVFAVPPFLRGLWLLARTLPVDGSVRQMGEALLQAMVETDWVRTSGSRLEVRTQVLADDRVSAWLEGATFYERSLFADAFAEILEPIRNPRYLVIREQTWPWRRRDYHAVPTPLGARKDRAVAFHREWVRRLGDGELVYTRTREGRQRLLRARARAFSGGFASRSERNDRWI